LNSSLNFSQSNFYYFNLKNDAACFESGLSRAKNLLTFVARANPDVEAVARMLENTSLIGGGQYEVTTLNNPTVNQSIPVAVVVEAVTFCKKQSRNFVADRLRPPKFSVGGSCYLTGSGSDLRLSKSSLLTLFKKK
jgi:hypothetical protein